MFPANSRICYSGATWFFLPDEQMLTHTHTETALWSTCCNSADRVHNPNLLWLLRTFLRTTSCHNTVSTHRLHRLCRHNNSISMTRLLKPETKPPPLLSEVIVKYWLRILSNPCRYVFLCRFVKKKINSDIRFAGVSIFNPFRQTVWVISSPD